MKKLFMILLVFVCSIVLCVSVFAVEAQACDDGCEAEAVQQEEVAETASASVDCNHVNIDDSGDKWYVYFGNEDGYYGPTNCKRDVYVTITCADCGAELWDQYIETQYVDHVWRTCYKEAVECTYCIYCEYHTRRH